MFTTLLFLHSSLRWLVVIAVWVAIYRAGKGYLTRAPFTKADDRWRHWTATLAHVQMVIGMVLYVQRPLTAYFWQHFPAAIQVREIAFFGLWHILLMLAAVVALTIGSAMAKRKSTDRDKFRAMLIGCLIAAVLILVAIPWPFSPFAHRPWIHPL